MLDISPIISSVPPTDWIRLVLVYFHLICCAFALALVLNADWRILKGDFTTDGLRQMAHTTSAVLVLLWVSGILLVYHDTGLDLLVISELAKLQLKLITVVALTINGFVLHHVSFPIMIKKRRKTLMESLFLSVTGTISTSHWLLAAFIGIARPLGRWPLETLLMAYGLYVGVAMTVAIICAPIMQLHLNRCFNASHIKRRSERQSERLKAHHSLKDLGRRDNISWPTQNRKTQTDDSGQLYSKVSPSEGHYLRNSRLVARR